MRGGSQPQLMRCDDGGYYVVKFQNNPQGTRILANELLGVRLALLLALPVAHGEVVMVGERLISLTRELVMELAHDSVPFRSGLAFGSRMPTDSRESPLHDIIPRSRLLQVQNMRDFFGMLVFDLWTGNCDARQTVFYRPDQNAPYKALMIDQGFCFGGAEWKFPESTLPSLYWLDRRVYEDVEGMDAFEPWLHKLECVGEATLHQAAEGIPPEWFHDDNDSMSRLMCELYERRRRVRDFLWLARNSIHNPFPRWLSFAAIA